MHQQGPKTTPIGGIISLSYNFVRPKVTLASDGRQGEADDSNAVALCMAAVLCCFSSSRHSGQGVAEKHASRDVKKLRVADTVHNEITKEVGRIVRIVNIHGPGYIVVKANKPTGKEIEALWRPRELKELRDRARKYRAASRPNFTKAVDARF